ncbi:transient receptor potential channel pyrexia [Pelomyxa schiedti]|nr:transient receptor potential channel pyrexia [Pelomyxa schiedti]
MKLLRGFVLFVAVFLCERLSAGAPQQDCDDIIEGVPAVVGTGDAVEVDASALGAEENVDAPTLWVKFFDAVTAGNVEAVKDMLKPGSQARSFLDREEAGKTALLHALGRQNLELSEALLEAGASTLTIEDQLYRKAREGHKAFVELLLKYGADVNKPEPGHRRIPLHGALEGNKPEVVELLLKAGADIEAEAAYGRSALNFALMEPNCKPMVEMLLKAGANVEHSDSRGRTALHIAAGLPGNSGGAEVVQMLIDAGAFLDPEDDLGQTPIFYCKDPAIVKVLITAGASFSRKNPAGESVVQYMFKDGRKEAAKVIILHDPMQQHRISIPQKAQGSPPPSRSQPPVNNKNEWKMPPKK